MGKSTQNKIELKIITPQGIKIHENVDLVTISTIDGYVGLQKGRLPLIGSLKPSVMLINSSSSSNHRKIFLESGIVNSSKVKVEIITSGAYFKKELNISKINKEIDKAETILANKNSSKKEIEKSKQILIIEKSKKDFLDDGKGGA